MQREKRIQEGSKEKMRKVGSKGAPTSANFKRAAKTAKKMTAAWQRKEGKNPKGGLNAKGRASYNRETGGNLKAPTKKKEVKEESLFVLE